MNEPTAKNTGAENEPILRVEWYAGHHTDAEPRCLHIGQREILVTEIVGR